MICNQIEIRERVMSVPKLIAYITNEFPDDILYPPR
jgi:hypothetical protein